MEGGLDWERKQGESPLAWSFWSLNWVVRSQGRLAWEVNPLVKETSKGSMYWALHLEDLWLSVQGPAFLVYQKSAYYFSLCYEDLDLKTQAKNLDCWLCETHLWHLLDRESPDRSKLRGDRLGGKRLGRERFNHEARLREAQS